MKNTLLFFLTIAVISQTSFSQANPPEHPSHGEKHSKHHSFADAKKWSKVFDDPARDAWQKPKEVVTALEMNATDSVADIGAGTGYFIPHLASAVSKGHVFATDVEKTLVDHMNARIKKDKLLNASAVLSKMDDPSLPAPVDLALIVDTYHHIENREAYFELLKKALRGKSRVAIIDFKVESKLGPKHKIASEVVIKEMETAGYALDKMFPFLPEQYFLIFSSKTDRTH